MSENHFAFSVKGILTGSYAGVAYPSRLNVTGSVLDDLVVFSDKIVITVVLAKLVSLDLFVVLIEVAVSVGALSENHCAVLTELILTGGEGSTGNYIGGEVTSRVYGILVVLANVVPIAFERNELIGVDLYVVIVEVAVGPGTILGLHLAISVKVVVACGVSGALKVSGGEVTGLVYRIFVVLGNKVVIALVCAKLVRGLLLVVDVEVTVGLRTVDGGEMTLGVKVVVAYGEISAFDHRSVQITSLISGDLVVFGNQIPVSVVHAELIRLLLLVVDIEVIVFVGAVEIHQNTVFIELIVANRKAGAFNNSSVQIASLPLGDLIVLGNQIPIAVELNKRICFELDTVLVNSAVFLYAVLEIVNDVAIIIEFIVTRGNIAVSALIVDGYAGVSHRLEGAREVVVLIVVLYQAGVEQIAVLEVVDFLCVFGSEENAVFVFDGLNKSALVGEVIQRIISILRKGIMG